MEAKEGVLDRVEQSFEIYKNNFKVLFIPMFLYSFVSTVLTVITTYIFIKYVQGFLENEELSGMKIYELLYSPQSITIIIGWIILLIIYITLYIPFVIWLIKTVSQTYKWEKPNWKTNLNYWFKNLLNAFKTYWYIFAYVALIPALLFIIGWVLTLYWMQYNQDNITTIGGVIVWISLIIFLVFMVYRWTRSAFAIQSAVDKDTYSKTNFKQSVEVTQNKFWRIIWNVMLIWFIGWLAIGMIQWAINWVTASMWMWFDQLFSSVSNSWDNLNELQGTFKEILGNYSLFWSLITWTIQTVIQTLFSVFMLVFLYIFYKRLEVESGESVSTLSGSTDEL